MINIIKYRKLIEAIIIAKSILDFVSGDHYKRECTKDERKEFYKLYDEIFPNINNKQKLEKT